jgi:phosphoesterase RecJ-like protein
MQNFKIDLNLYNNIVVVSHKNPDGDAIGSASAMAQLFLKLGKKANIVLPNALPDNFMWLPLAQQLSFFDKDAEKSKKLIVQADLIVCVDFNHLNRLGDQMHAFIERSLKPMLMIDHHEEPSALAKYLFSDTKYGSTCEMVYEFIKYNEWLNLVDQDIATAIYTGILTDSGGFRFPKTTSNTHHIVANLLTYGIDNTDIYDQIFNQNSLNSIGLLGRALQNMVCIPEKQTCYISLTQAELDQFHYKKGDTEGLVNYGLTIKNINFAVIFIENRDENIIKMSLRSKGDIDVNTFARTYFNGGGHKNAAGGKSLLNMTESITFFLEKLDDFIK